MQPPEKRAAAEERARAADAGFAEDVAAGLVAAPKHLSCTYLYDREGSRLFEQICQVPEYYPTRAEREILARRAGEIVRRFARGASTAASVSLIELGSGSSTKTAWLLDAFLAAGEPLRYVPVDVSRSMLEESCAALAARRPALEVAPVAAEYQAGLRRVQASERGRAKLILWLGSSVGNLHPPDAVAFLRSLRELTSGRDRLLIGIDLRKARRVLERAYDDERGVTARFNLNLLARINRELGGHFDLRRFRHRAIYDERAGCVSMYLVSRGAQRVAIDRLAITAHFTDGETIHTECSYKYRPDEIDALARDSGFAVERRWLDRRRRFSLNLLRPVAH